jgi:anti-sigma B factor antagonist
METTKEYKRIDVSEVDGVTVVRFKDEKIIEDEVIEEMGQELFELVEVQGVDRILVSFRGVDFVSSAAFGKFLTLDKKTKAVSAVLRLSNIRPEIYEVFAITKFNRVFDIRDDETEALAAF